MFFYMSKTKKSLQKNDDFETPVFQKPGEKFKNAIFTDNKPKFRK